MLFFFQTTCKYFPSNVLHITRLKHTFLYTSFGWDRFSVKEDTWTQTLTISSFSMRANREGMSAVCRVPSSVVQAAKAGINTWWTALTTRSDGSASDSSISSKPWKTHTSSKRWAGSIYRKSNVNPWGYLTAWFTIFLQHCFNRKRLQLPKNNYEKYKGKYLSFEIPTHIPGNTCQGHQCNPW